MTINAPQRLADALYGGYQQLGRLVARWTRLSYHGPAHLPAGPALMVANHGFGTIYDMNALIIAALLYDHAPADDTAITVLAHDAAWRIGFGGLAERLGMQRANRDNARAALDAGHLVLVLPGGDIDAAKPFGLRNTVQFDGRHGFADIAMEAGVPVIPLVVSGAGETAIVLSSGRRLARTLGVSRLLRLKTLPVSLSMPWGLSVGVAGMAVPYLPLPAKMQARVLPAMTPLAGESAATFAARILSVMNTAMAEMTENRLPFIGLRWPRRV